jgi:hypothetical protein
MPNNDSTPETPGQPRQGVFILGEFRAIREGTPWVDRNGESQRPAIVKILGGDAIFDIEYKSDRAALDALGGTVPEVGRLLQLAVYAEGSWDTAAKRRGDARFRGA